MARDIEIPEIDVPPDRTSKTQWSQLLKIAGTALSVLVIAFLLLRSIVIHPRKPQFTLQDVTLYDFNISADRNLLSSTLQATVSSRNPNAQIGLYYDSLEAYATYHGQQVTSRSEIPSTYEGHKSGDVWSMLISGTSVPVAPYTAMALTQDWSNGLVVIEIKLGGQARWKLSSIAKGGNHITVKCPAYLTFGAYNTGISVGYNAVKYQLLQRCNVDFSK